MTSAGAYDPRLKPTLVKACQAYRRRDDGAFRDLLREAIRMAPHRLDLRFNLANHHIQIGDPAGGIAVFREIAELAPRDADALLCLAYWLDFVDDRAGSDAAAARLGEARPEAEWDLMRLLETVRAWRYREVSDAVPALDGPSSGAAIVVLGFVLRPDGGMRPELIERLEKARSAAAAYPDARVVVSGGVPRSDRVEAVVMRQWLMANGVDESRIVEEGYSRDLVENLIYSRQILDILGSRTALVVTSAHNVRRAGAAMETLAWRCGSSWRVATVAASGQTLLGFADDGADTLKLYRDALRAYGMPMMRSYPELVEL